MSIPPLVCSTPPPPEQCEEDKDPEDFDLHYHLSQEEEEDDESSGFEFGNRYLDIDIPTTENKKSNVISSADTKVENIPFNDFRNINENISKDSMDHNLPDLPLEDDVQVEDLNLEINQAPGVSSKSKQHECENNVEENIVKDLHTDIPLDSNNISQQDFVQTRMTKDKNEDNTIENEMISRTVKSEESYGDNSYSPYNKNIVISDDDSKNLNCVANEEAVLPKGLISDIDLKSSDNNDFEDFEDFKFASSDSLTEVMVGSTDPWESNTSEDVGFGEFTANFDSVNIVSAEPVDFHEKASETFPTHIENTNDDDDDDFGDFDEFKTCAADGKTTTEPLERIQPQQVPVFDIYSNNEHQILESINKVLETVFPEEISEPEEQLERKLEISLGETWSYLKETDTRQPYIVNWNNSLAQKTLLKALCIDSRNILFGPRWSFNTPKYAANLGAAPLQPQKQITQTNSHQTEQSTDVDKTANKTSWVDPFTADGQEFTYAEALLLDLEHLMATLDQMANNHSTLKISELLSNACNVENENNVTGTGPTDLDVFEAAMSSKTDKIYSSTLNIQPIRQINLPDTHIFTPTDSETPRSKTIHYDNSTTHNILLPQSVPPVVKDQHDEFPAKQKDNDLQNDDDYWDFQDFRTNSETKSSSADTKSDSKSTEVHAEKHVPSKAKLPLETQVLQPIKLEPLMPTLNWPNPGEVKETFDDFSDFVSKSVLMNDKHEVEVVKQNNIDAGKITLENAVKQCDKVEDDFDMFQSALPASASTTVPIKSNHSDVTSFTQKVYTKVTDFEPKFPKGEQSKSDNISFLNTKPTANTIHKVSNTNNVDELNFKTQSSGGQTSKPSLLQPTVTSTHGQQKAGQILQPLSLESYSQINWPNPGIDLQDLSRFNPVESLQSLKHDASTNSKNSTPTHNTKPVSSTSQVSDEDIWGEFVSSKPKPQQTQPKKQSTFADDDEWTDFVSSPSLNTQNGLNTISFNVHTNSGIQKPSTNKYPSKNNNIPLDIPTLNYITPKTANQKSYNDRHFQNL